MFDFLTSESKYQVTPSSHEIEPHEVVVDSFVSQEQKLEIPLSKTALRGFFITFAIMLAVFLFKTVSLQAFSGSEWQELSRKNVSRETLVVPDRGVLYDQHLTPLVKNEPSFDFVCDKRDMSDSILKLIAKEYPDAIEEFDKNPSPVMLVKENLSHEELVVLNVRIGEFEGCEIQENKKREYVYGSVMAHLLGYTAKISRSELQPGYSPTDQIGKDGVEKTYEGLLRGVPGIFAVKKDAQGKTLEKSLEKEPEPGQSLMLWLDARLQTKLEQALQQTFSNTGAKKGAAVALDPQTGGVLSLVSLPSFDTNAFSAGLTPEEWQKISNSSLHPLFNRAISGLGYPTGSVIKPFVGAAALKEGIIEPATTLFAPLEICVDNQYTKEKECFRDNKFHGWSDIKRAIAESVNTFFYMVGGGFEDLRGLGARKIVEYLSLFGWGKETGVDLPGEGKGVLPEINNQWRLGDTYHLSIGQGPFAATPLQVAVGTAAIANGGTLFQPQAVRGVRGGESFGPKIMQENILDQDILEVIKQGMRQTVTKGSATGWLDGLPVKAAAKTGTAQTGKRAADGKEYLYSWITAFAPLENPEIVLVVIVEDVKEGNVAALPVARDTLQAYFSQ